MNTDAPWPDADMAWWRVLKIQTKLHQWATDDADRRFDDLYNLVCDPAVLMDAWQRVKGNKGARVSAGVRVDVAEVLPPPSDARTFHAELVLDDRRGVVRLLLEVTDPDLARGFSAQQVADLLTGSAGLAD